MRVREAMTPNVHACERIGTLERAAQIMWERDCGSVPIVSGARMVVGVVTDRDITMACYIQGKRPSEIGVMEVMSRVVHACEPGTPIEDVLGTSRGDRRRCLLERRRVIHRGGIES